MCKSRSATAEGPAGQCPSGHLAVGAASPGPAAASAAAPAPAAAGLVLRGLAELPGEAMVDADALGAALAVSARTVQRLVGQGQLPPGVELGGKTLWIVGRVLAWLAGRAEQAEKKAAGFRRNAS